MPNDKYLENRSLEFKAIFIPRQRIRENKPVTIKAHATPNSSAMIEKIKSV